MPEDSPAPKRRRRVAMVDRGTEAPEAVPAAPSQPSRLAELEAEVATLRKDLADAQRAVEALRKR